MKTWTIGLTIAIAIATAGLVAPTAYADSSCSPGQDLWSCAPAMPATTAAEKAFVQNAQASGLFPGVDATTLNRAKYGVMGLLNGGDSTNHIVPNLAQHLGVSNAAAGQFLDQVLGSMSIPGVTEARISPQGTLYWAR